MSKSTNWKFKLDWAKTGYQNCSGIQKQERILTNNDWSLNFARMGIQKHINYWTFLKAQNSEEKYVILQESCLGGDFVWKIIFVAFS